MDLPMRVTLADVAARAGVSLATVSKVANGRYGVAPGTMTRVQEVIDELGYAGHLGAISLRSSRTNVLGILLSEFEPFSLGLLRGMSDTASASGYDLMAFTGGGKSGWERRSLARLGGTLIDGAILVTPTVLGPLATVPVVAIDPHYGPSQVPTVDADSFAGANLATAYLIGLGHRRIAFLGGRGDLESAHLREAGFREAMADAGLPVDEDLVRATHFQPQLAEVEARALLSLSQPPTAIFAANDITAERTIAVARSMGLAVPADVSVLGFDDIPEAALCDPPLTTVRQPLREMGEAAMNMLLDLLKGLERSTHTRLPVELVIRASCAAPRR
jgi:LacI family transcriptional regulator